MTSLTNPSPEEIRERAAVAIEVAQEWAYLECAIRAAAEREERLEACLYPGDALFVDVRSCCASCEVEEECDGRRVPNDGCVDHAWPKGGVKFEEYELEAVPVAVTDGVARFELRRPW